jgi:putative photosynthetic complex assembly protein
VGSAAIARHGGVGVFAQAASPTIEERRLRFADRDDGAVVVEEVGTARPLMVFDPGTNGFVRGALRGLVRERKRRDIGPDTPFVLVRRADDRLVLQDPATGAFIDLAAFGRATSNPSSSS